MPTFNDLLNGYTVPDLKSRLNLLPGDGPPPTRKADIIATIRDYLLSSNCRQLWQELEQDEQAAVGEALHHWAGRFQSSRFAAKYGDLPQCFKPRGFGRNQSKPARKRDYLSLFFYDGQIPDELCTLLATFVPAPSATTIKTVAEEDIPRQVEGDPPWGMEDKADASIRLLSTEMMARQDLFAMLRLVENGELSVSEKTGMPGAAALRRVDGLLAGGDYYAPEDDWKLDKFEGSPIRPIRPFAWPLLLQVAGLAKPKGKVLELTRKGKAALRAPFEQTIRNIYARWRDKGNPDEFRRIEQIKGQTSKSRPMAPANERRQTIERTLRELPPGEWLEFDAFYRYSIARGHFFQVARDSWRLYMVDATYGSMAHAGDSFLDVHYLKVYFMEYLATLGLLDIGYAHPGFGEADYAGLWGVDELVYLSRYDGLLYIRLTTLGAYCLGLSEDYKPQLAEAKALFDVDAALRIRLLRTPEAAQAMLLQQFAHPIADNGWQLSGDDLLAAAANGLDVADFHQFLQQNAVSDLPAEVTRLFEQSAARSTAVTDVGAARLLNCASASLAKALASDPATSPYCLHAGGRTLVVPNNKMQRFREALRKLGYVIPAPGA